MLELPVRGDVDRRGGGVDGYEATNFLLCTHSVWLS